jgi:hypothetical protein
MLTCHNYLSKVKFKEGLIEAKFLTMHKPYNFIVVANEV